MFDTKPASDQKDFEEEMKAPLPLVPGKCLLRPPSVVVSDHDLNLDSEFITLDDLDAEFNRSQISMGRRLSDCSTCSSLSFSDPDFMTIQQEEEVVDEVGQKVSKYIILYLLCIINVTK